ncbi:U-box domain-containing protein 13-like [Apium graveolens]|uniref:U-box domain-containing protein 13-like n=1 Tax=Apium graveolens TaxID=4045 RepID=UPI003D792FD0
MEDDDAGRAVVKEMIELVSKIAEISDYRSSVKKQYCNLARRLKLLTPMFEEIRDSEEKINRASVDELSKLKEAMLLAFELLQFGSQGSKIYMVLEREKIMKNLQEVTVQLENALSGISFEQLDISDEIQEQVELVLAQFRRAKGRIDGPNVELFEDLLSLYNMKPDAVADSAVLRRLVDNLQLSGITDLTQESLALHEMVATSGSDPGESIEKMSMLLKKIKDFVQTEDPNIDSPVMESGSVQAATDRIQKIPEDFRCPISLELMVDPVIVSTGQTYERSCIEKWLEAGHGTCPKTQQTLSSLSLTPNYVLRSLIAQWCEANGVEPPKRSVRLSKTKSACTPAERSKIDTLLHKLTSVNPEDKRFAAGEIRLLAKRNADNRVALAEAGAIPLLVGLLSTPDSRTQEHAVTALLNLSICEENKGSIVSSGAVPGIVYVLKKGSMEARENAAATLFSLSVVDENKVTIGGFGAIPPLVTLLSEGNQRGKKDAATALFNLCIYQGNKGKAVRAGIVPTLMKLLTEPQGGMVDESLAILAILASHSEGRAAIGAAEALPVLVAVIGSGSPRNKENAAAVLVHLCSADQQYLVEAQELGVMSSLIDLVQTGTDRGKRKAGQLLERIKQQNQAPTLNESQAQVLNESQFEAPSPSLVLTLSPSLVPAPTPSLVPAPTPSLVQNQQSRPSLSAHFVDS